ncbi:hypothetical protein, partial [Methylomonas fluvii]
AGVWRKHSRGGLSTIQLCLPFKRRCHRDINRVPRKSTM